MTLPVRAITWGKVFLLSFFMMLLFQVTGHCGEKAGPVSDYHTLVKQLKNGDTSIDFARLRFSFTKAKDYNPYSHSGVDHDAMIKALNEDKFEDAIKRAQAVLEKNYVDLDAILSAGSDTKN